MLSNNQVKLEQEILGSLLKNEELIIRAKETIKPEMFLYEPHMKIYMGILEMVSKKIAVDLVTFLEYHRLKLRHMDGICYVTDIYGCIGHDSAFQTKLEFLVDNYKKKLYIDMARQIHGDKTLENIENTLKDTKVQVRKCDTKKELDIVVQYDKYLNWLYNPKKEAGIKSGFNALDKYLGNFQKGRLITIFARSAIGKSTFSIQLASNMVQRRAKVFYGSAEMSEKEVFNRMVSSKFELSNMAIEDDAIDMDKKDDITEYVAKLMNNCFYISTETDLRKFINEIKVYKLQHSLDVVFVDYINKYIDYSDKDMMTNKLGKISGTLKTLALEEDICVVLVAQANRAVDKKNGDLALEKIDSGDIQDSARIEQDSDQVIALYRNSKFDDKLYKDAMFKQGKINYSSKNPDLNPECINAIITKNRHGARGTCAFKWKGGISRITNF